MIAYPRKVVEGQKSAKIFEGPAYSAESEKRDDEDKRQSKFDDRVEEVLEDVVKDLRNKNAHLIDDKAVRNIKKGNVSYRVYDQDNSINTYEESQKICYSDIKKLTYGGDLHHGMTPDRFQLISNPYSYMEK